MDLDIHLDRCDTFVCTGYLEVHISEEVFESLNICKYKIIIICITCNQSTWDSGYCSLDRYTCWHQWHRRCTYTCLRSRTIWFKCLRYSTDRIWEFCFAWKYRKQCTLCQCSMSDLTTSRSSGWLCLTYRVWWEVVVVHISLCCLCFIQTIQFLSFRKWCQCTDVADLCLSTSEHCRTMYSRDQVNFCCKWSDLVDLSSVRTFVVF